MVVVLLSFSLFAFAGNPDACSDCVQTIYTRGTSIPGGLKLTFPDGACKRRIFLCVIEGRIHITFIILGNAIHMIMDFS